jgi:hypothetical protein
MNVPGRELKGIHFAMDFLPQQNKRVAGDADIVADPSRLSEPVLATGKRVVIIGGGTPRRYSDFTPAKRVGASVEILPQPPENVLLRLHGRCGRSSCVRRLTGRRHPSGRGTTGFSRRGWQRASFIWVQVIAEVRSAGLRFTRRRRSFLPWIFWSVAMGDRQLGLNRPARQRAPTRIRWPRCRCLRRR